MLLFALFLLAACGEDEPDYDDLDDFEEDLLEAFDEWESASLYNEVEFEQQGQVLQHMLLGLHHDYEEDEIYMQVENLLEDEMTDYMYATEDEVYLFNTVPKEDEDGEPTDETEEQYIIEDRDEVEGDIPEIRMLLQNGLQMFPREDEEADIEIEEFTFEYDEDETTFDIQTSMTFEDELGEEETVEWRMHGDFTEFTLESPDPSMGDMTFVEKHFFDDFEGIDKDLHEEVEDDENGEEENEEEQE